MKNLFMMLLMVFSSMTMFAQSSNQSDEAFFIGKWNLFVEGLPTGDAEMLLVIQKDAEGKLCGTIGGTDGSATNKLTKVVIKDKTLQVNFLGGGYDVPVYLDREKDGSISGSMNDMFDCTGKKIVEKKK